MNEELVDRAILLSKTVAQRMHRSDNAWLRCELTLAQMRCLFTVVGAGPLSIGGVGERLGIGLPSASALVDRLVEQELAVRREDPGDRRRTLVSATAAGTTLAERLRQGSMETMRGWLRQLRPQDMASLLRGLEALARVADPDPDEAGAIGAGSAS
jgi:DNA-binding MarR family transcriptional regulator